jgi:Protein of unknown function (DUF2975)
MKSENENLNRIQRVSGTFRLLFTVLIFCIPVATLMYWLLFNYLPVGLTAELPVVVNQALPLKTLLLAFLVSLIPASVAIYGIINLKELFILYEKAIVFSERNVKCFRRLGYTLIYWVVANLIFVMLISIVLTFNNSPGDRMMVAQFGISDIGTLIIGAVVVLVSWVMNEASKLEDEQAHTV